MRSRPTALSPLPRSLAAATLLVWITAQAMCTAHCSLGVGHGDSSQPSCHGAAASTTHHEDDHSGAPSDHGSQTAYTCKVLKSALLMGSAPVLVEPELHLLYLLSPLVTLLNATRDEPQASPFRQAWRRDWVFTPEVYLGPALRSLAPPLLS